MSTVNLYDVLNISSDCSETDIKKAYNKLVKVFHPDMPTGDKEMFKLITHAYDILKVPKKRAKYDKLYNTISNSESDHFILQKQSKNFADAQKTSSTSKSKKDIETKFKKEFEILDTKRGYKRNKDETKMSETDIMEKLSDLQIMRADEDIENACDELFETFVPEKFNEAFDIMYKKSSEIIKYDRNPNAWNTGSCNVFSGLDNYEDPFINDDDVGHSDIFGSVNLLEKCSAENNLTKKYVNKLKGASYTKDHNNIDKSYSELLQEKIAERELATSLLQDKSYNDFDTDPSCGGYGIFKDLSIGDCLSLNFDDDIDMKKKFNELLKLRE